MKKILLILCLILLASCVTAGGYKKILDKTIGFTEEQLIMAIGAPSQSYTTGNLKVLEYYESSQGYVPNYQQQTTNYYNNYGSVGSSSQWVNNSYYVNYSCRTTFFLKGGRVINYKFYGNGCVA